MTCAHENFQIQANVIRRTEVEGGPVVGFSADISIQCADCLTPFEFVGLGCGMSPIEPMTDPLRQELRAPIVPQGEEPNPNLAGFRMQVVAPGARGPVS